MHLVQESAEGESRVLATEVDRADSLFAKIVGLMGKSSLPEGYALVFDFNRVSYRDVHMLFVRTPLDVIWLRDGEVVQVKTLQPWRGTGIAKADCFVELPAGAADGVEPGDLVRFEDAE